MDKQSSQGDRGTCSAETLRLPFGYLWVYKAYSLCLCIVAHTVYYLLYISKLELIKASFHYIFNSVSLYLKGIQTYLYVGHSYKNIVSYIKVVTIRMFTFTSVISTSVPELMCQIHFGPGITFAHTWMWWNINGGKREPKPEYVYHF